ncbi:MAG: filamentous hemagglutinin family protein [Rhodoplanes sp.]|nr:filamentous hemagglutinin family protein [Rhodoplanes sp.]
MPRRAGATAHAALLAGVSTLALLIAAIPAGAGGLRDQRPTSPAAASVAAATAAAQTAAATASQEMTKLTGTLRSIREAQAAARAAALVRGTSVTAPVAVPNGLATGGLVPDSGLAASGVANPVKTWVGAATPTQIVSGDKSTVTIEQTAAQAILNWTSFNVGARTTLVFDQQGNASWVALNRVAAGTAPSQILGNLQADGQVYVINQNGIVFGGSSQVNVGSLIASTASITNSQFLTKGIYSTQSGSTYLPSFTGAGGKIVVEQGATITTAAPASVTSAGGFVLLMGTEVDNFGSITTPKGQAQLAAGDDFILRKGYGTDVNQFSTTRGNEIVPVIRAGSTSGSVRNSGLVFAQQGDITLAGHAVVQDGLLLSTTSVDQRGTVHLLNAASDTNGSVTLTGNAVTAVLPELDSTATALDSQRNTLIAASGVNTLAIGQFDNLSVLADRLDLSRIEIVTGGLVDFQSGSLTSAPGGQVAVGAAQRVFAASGATIDVSGTTGTTLAMSANTIKVNVQGNELRDSSASRDNGGLVNSNVWIDIRDLVLVAAGTGGYATDRYYTADGLLEVSGYLGNIGHTIGERMAVGGTITLAAPQVVAQQGSTFDISGGSVGYAGGWITTTRVLGSDGRTYDIGSVPSNVTVVGLGSDRSRTHARWSVTETWSNRLWPGATRTRYEPGYTVGRDAGRLVLSTPTAVFEGDIVADVTTGERQTAARPSGVTDGYKLTQKTVAQAGTLAIGQYSGYGRVGAYGSEVKIGAVDDVTAGMKAGDVLARAANTIWLDAGRLNGQGLGGLSIATKGTIAVNHVVTLADGGAVEFIAPVVDINADITARSGSITATNVFVPADALTSTLAFLKDGGSTMTLGEGVTLDVRGRWVNLLGNAGDAGKLGLIDGGSVRLDSTHDVVVAKGSRIDVSSGAAQLAVGKTKGGKGGNVTLIADHEVVNVTANGLLTLDGTIAGYGVSGGGTLKIASGTAITIGGKLTETDGVLKKGETALAGVVLAEDYAVRKGDVLPVDYSYTTKLALPGEAIGPAGVKENVNFTPARDWTPPAAPKSSGGRNQYIIYMNGSIYYVDENAVVTARSDGAKIPFIPAGSKIQIWRAQYFPTYYVVPGDVFPDGMPIPEQQRTIKAGNPSPVDFAVKSGSVLSAGTGLGRDVAVLPTTALSADLFQTGFSNYDVTGRTGVVVTTGTRLDVVMPVYRVTAASASIATGADPAAAFDLWTPPLDLENPAKGVLTRRSGADLTLRAVTTDGSSGNSGASGPVVIDANAAITVDPGRSLTLLGRDITVDGRLSARGGTITLDRAFTALDTARDIGSSDPSVIWIGEHGVLDVSGLAATAVDARGRRYGTVTDGGTIRIGGGLDWEDKGIASAPDAFVVIRPGALLDASGASAVLDIPASGLGATSFRATSTPLTVASDGGSIVVKSNNGLYLDGTLRAAAGGVGAAGGTLAVALEAANYPAESTIGDVLRHRELVLAQVQGDSLLPQGVTAATVAGRLATGTARLGVDHIAAGGFDTLSLLVDGVLSFDGNVSLAMRQSLRLYAGTYAHGADTAAGATVSLAAPHVLLAGVTRVVRDHYKLPRVGWADGPSQQASDGVFRVTADLIDIRDRVGFGASGSDAFTGATIDRRGFALVDLVSRGDIRLLGGTPGQSLSGGTTTELAAPGDIVLTAQQIYPATDAIARIYAGYAKNAYGEVFAPGSSLTIRRYGSGDVPMPYSAFGQLSLLAETIDQGGIVRAPFGSLTLGSLGGASRTEAVNLLAGSITSVSGAGLTMPYGGTTDGTTYNWNGSAVSLSSGKSILLNTAHLDIGSGAIVDLSGGGELTGAGFVSGRGGSVDVLKTPLAGASPGYAFSSAGNAVYAIVPSSTATYAPVAAEAGYGTPLIGRQITIPAGVPGLPAGTYTLMPSTYALLPGAYRVEIGAGDQTALAGATAVGNGSWLVAGTLGIVGTGIRDALPSRVLVTSAAAVRAHSSYNETDYKAFVLADAVRLGVPRAMTTLDSGSLVITLAASAAGDVRPALTIDGAVRLTAETGSTGYAGSVSIGGVSEVLASGQSATPGMPGASVDADALSALNAPRLLLNASIVSVYGQTGRFVTITGTGDLVVRSGATIAAGEVILGSSRRDAVGAYADGRITIEEGASIIARSTGARAFDSSDGYVFVAEGALVVSSGWINLVLAAQPSYTDTGVNIDIGACITAACGRTTTLVSDGTIAIATNRALTIADNVAYGTRNLVLGVSAVDLGENASIAAAAAAGRLPAGLVLNQTRLAQLLAGNTATGAPALETLVLNAHDAVNVFGTVELDASSLARLVLGTPAIYGYGAAGDVATIRAGEFVWTGAAGTPGAPIASALGSGVLDIKAASILFGYGPNTMPSSTAVDDRLALGFSTVRLDASEQIAAGGKSTLSVYQSRGDYVASTGWTYSGGNLAVTAPLVTGKAGSKFTVSAGGDVTIAAPVGAATNLTSDALGATLAIAGQSISVDTAVVLPSGRLTLSAAGTVTLGGRARIDLAGRKVALYDVEKYSWGGDLVLTSSAGDITQAAGSSIDLSALHNRGGTLTATALGAGGGHVDLAGAIRGGATGSYDAGGTVVPFDGAEVTIRAQTLTDFAGLNARLNLGEVFGARRFQIKQGDLIVGDEVKARTVEIAMDGGGLTVAGRIDASGFQVGTIRLAAKGDLTVAGTLDAHGTGLRLDSYGKIIDSSNRAIVALTTVAGRLTLSAGSVIDLRAGSESARADGTARGTLDLMAPRVGGNDVAVDVLGRVDVRGAKTIAVYGFRTYDDAPLAALPDVSGSRPQLITQGYLDAIDGDSVAFIDAALANAALSARLAGLGAYHLRPGVEIVSNAVTNPSGNLSVSGDLDLSGYRYGPGADRGNAALRGFGEPGMLVIRAAGNLDINGSINDGFAPPAATPDDSGWVLTEARSDYYPNGYTPFGGDIVVPIDGVVLDVGTTFQAGVTLNYAVPVAAMTLPAGTVLPVDVVLTGPMSLSAGTVVAATITNADGSVAYRAGTVLTSSVTLGAGMTLGAGTPLGTATAVAALTWPKGVKLPVQMITTAQVALARGSLIPSMTKVELPDDKPIDLRPASAGFQGRNWAVAPMLGEGATSWSLTLVAGADVAAADRRATNPASKGTIRLADTHYSVKNIYEQLPGGVWYWTADNYYGGTPGTPVDDWALQPGANVCEQDASQCVRVSWLWSADNYYGGTPGAPVDAWALDPAFNVCTSDPTQCVHIGGPGGQGPLIAVDTVAPMFSVIRTGTGDLSLVAAGDIRMDSLYGVYTAGTATSTAAAYNLARGTLSDGSVLGASSADYASVLASYRAWYPDHGGNVLIAAGGNLVGDIVDAASGYANTSSAIAGNWLWRQGSGSAAVDATIAAAWWINFGTYARLDTGSGTISSPVVVGFTGIGALGGGNVTIRVGGDAGKIDTRGSEDQQPHDTSRSQGLVVAVGSTGRVGSNGSLALTGGGDIDIRVAGALNPLGETNEVASDTALSGSVINLRGTTQLAAASIGEIRTIYRGSNGVGDTVDPRGADPFEASRAASLSGLVLVPGDSAFYLQTQGDMVVAGAGDATRSYQLNGSVFSANGSGYTGGGRSWFTLWTDHTTIDLTSAGGNMAPSKAGSVVIDNRSADLADTWPSILRVAALGGSIYYGASAGLTTSGFTSDILAPSDASELSILAAGSIYGGKWINVDPYVSRHTLVLSATGTRLPTPFDPAFVGRPGGGTAVVSNLSADGDGVVGDPDTTGKSPWGDGALFAFGPDTAATASARNPDAEPIRIYAVSGDIVGLGTGNMRSFGSYTDRSVPTWYMAGAALRMRAGRDIVASGTLTNPDLIVHSNETDVSVVSAGRDILYSNVNVAGPGVLEVSAGRNILQEDKGSITSIGPVAIGDTRSGASIAMLAGVGTDGPDYAALRARYLDPANLLPAGTPLVGSGKVAKTYEAELIGWLKARYGVTVATVEEALAIFDALAPEQQHVFLRGVYYAELTAGGREYNDPTSRRFGSYARGREAIATLFPQDGAARRTGSIVMYGGSGVRTNFGGDIQMLVPGGQIVIGVEGVSPPSTAGLITQGQGDIQLYSKGSILLGLSRLMTTFGGDILAWSAEGDINAGRGAKTTVIYSPPKRTYDNYGNVTLAPTVPSSGAGIATLAPIPEVKAGDVDLIAPLGTIDAGEAGIRVSGNVNLAALQIINAANIQVQGRASGLPTVQAPDIGSALSASSTAGAAAKEAAAPTQSSATDRPSIIIVEILGYGGSQDGEERGRNREPERRSDNAAPVYDPRGPVRILGVGPLTDDEKRTFAADVRDGL